MAKTDDILRLHTDPQGSVWCGQSGIQAYNSKLSPEEFVLRPVFQDARHIRVLGVPVNAKLICLIHDTWQRADDYATGHRLQIGSPVCYLSNPVFNDTRFVLQQMWQPTSSARSSWHTLTQKDYTSYLAIHSLQQSTRVDDKLLAIMAYHPAWKALTFVTTHDVEACCRLVCEIVDPRWYNHHSRPDRASRLLSYLGMSPEVFATRQASSQKLERAATVIKAWSSGSPEAAVDFGDPRNFVWRIYRNAGGGPTGLLRASRTFIEFIRFAWLQGVSQPGRRVFNPAMFFKHNQHEAFAYTTHVGFES